MKTNRTVLIMAEIAVLAALALGLDYLASVVSGSLFIYGGSISIAMVPIMVIAFRRGLIAGLTCGLIVGIIQVIWGGHILQFFQFILDYPVPYMLVGAASITAVITKRINLTNIIIGSVIAGLLRYFSHVLAGVIFWSAYVPDEFNFFGNNITGFNPVSWSLFYNALYMIPTILVSTVVIAVLYKYADIFFGIEESKKMQIED